MPSSEPTRSLAASLDRAMLRELLRPIVGPHPRVDGYTTVRDADDYAVLIVDLAGPPARVVVKLAGPQATLACPFDRTAAINRIVRGQTTVPTPEALAADVSYRDWPWRYLVTTHNEGATWTETASSLDVAARRDLYRQLGQAVAQLHTIHFPAYGEIGVDGRVSEGYSLVAALEGRARRRVANPHHADLFVGLLRDRAHLFDGAPGSALCHEDLNPTNILLQRHGAVWRVAAILDFDSAWAGSPESDIARLDLWQSAAYPDLMDGGFRAAYEMRRPVAPGYKGRRAIYQLLWLLEYAGASTQHGADTQHVCAQLHIPPITFAT